MTNQNLFSEPLPTNDDYLAAIQDTLVEERIYCEESFRRAVGRCASSILYYRDFMREVQDMAKMIEPYDRSTGRSASDDAGVSIATLRGAAFGGILVPRLHGSAINLGDLVLPQPRSLKGVEDRGAELHQQAQFVHEFGGEGLALMGETAEAMLENVEEHVVEDVTKQRYFRIGCGVVVHAAHDAHVRYAQEVRTSALQKLSVGEVEIDWDTEIGSLLES